MPYQQVFELQEPDSFHGSKIVDQSINLGVKGVPGSLSSELFPSVFELPSTSLSVSDLTLTKGPSAGNAVIYFPHGYDIWADNTGSGSAANRLWIDGPDQGEVVIGPRAAADKLDRIRLRANEILFEWEDAGGDAASVTWPSGLIYDWGWDTDSGGSSLGAWPANLTNLVATASVPANVSVTIFVWAWIRLNLAVDQDFAALDVTIGGSLPQNPALVEQAMSTSTDNAGTTGAGGTGSTSSEVVAAHDIIHGGSDQVWDVATASHVTGSHQGESHSAHSHSGPSHTHPGGTHFHTIPGNWHTLQYNALRSYTPTGTTASLQARGGTSSGASQTYDDGALMWMVVIN